MFSYSCGSNCWVVVGDECVFNSHWYIMAKQSVLEPSKIDTVRVMIPSEQLNVDLRIGERARVSLKVMRKP